MASDVKYTSVVPSLTTTTPSLSKEQRMEMYSKLGLNQRYVDFLESGYNPKFLQYFEIGVDKIPMYGSIARMASESELIKSIVNLDPPYTLASNMTVLGGALTLLWLHLNGYFIGTYHVEKLSFPGFLNLFSLIGYFGADNGNLTIAFLEQYKRLIRFIDKNILIQYASEAAAMIDRLGFIRDRPSMAGRILEVNEVASKLTKIPILVHKFRSPIQSLFPDDDPYLTVMERKLADDPEELVKILKQNGFNLDVTGNFVNGDSVYAPVRQPNSIELYHLHLTNIPNQRIIIPQDIISREYNYKLERTRLPPGTQEHTEYQSRPPYTGSVL